MRISPRQHTLIRAINRAPEIVLYFFGALSFAVCVWIWCR